jgi:hypothetical protein
VRNIPKSFAAISLLVIAASPALREAASIPAARQSPRPPPRRPRPRHRPIDGVLQDSGSAVNPVPEGLTKEMLNIVFAIR